MIICQVTGAAITVAQNELLTTGMVQAVPVRFRFSPQWAALDCTAVFTAGTVSVSCLLGRITNASSRGNASPVRASTCVWGYTAPAGGDGPADSQLPAGAHMHRHPAGGKYPPLKPPPPSSKACLPRRKPPFRWQMPSGPMPMPGYLTAGMAKTAPTVRTEKTAKTALPAKPAPQRPKGDTGETGPSGDRRATLVKPALRDRRVTLVRPVPRGRRGDIGETGPQGPKGKRGNRPPKGRRVTRRNRSSGAKGTPVKPVLRGKRGPR